MGWGRTSFAFVAARLRASRHTLRSSPNALEINRLVNASLTRALSTPKIRLKGAQSYGFGFGLRNGPPPELPTIWHNGGSPGVGAEFDLNRGSGYAVIVLSNLDYPIIQPAIDLILNKLQIP